MKKPATAAFQVAVRDESMSLVLGKTEDRGELYLGDIDSAFALEKLRKAQVAAVLTVAELSGVRYAKEDGITHLIISADDVPSFNLFKHFSKGVEFIHENLKRTNVLVHCFAGISRSSSMVLAYLIKHHGYSMLDGLEFLCSRRSVVCPNNGFLRQLKRYQMQQNRQEHQQEQLSASKRARQIPPLKLRIKKAKQFQETEQQLIMKQIKLPIEHRFLKRHKPKNYSRAGSLNSRMSWLGALR